MGFKSVSRARWLFCGCVLLCALLSACAGSSRAAASPNRSVAVEPPSNLTPWKRLEWVQEQLRDCGDAQRAELLVRAAELYFFVDRPESASARAREALYTRPAAGAPAGSVPSRVHAVLGAVALDRGDLKTARQELTTALEAARDDTDSSVANALLAVVAERSRATAEAAAAQARVKRPQDPRVADYLQALGSFGVSTARCEPSPRAQAPALVPAASLTSIRIIPRANWKPAKIGPDTDPMTTPKRITVHHEGKEFHGSTLEDSLRQMRNIQEYHQRGKKWADIGYHYVIDRLGNVFEGRPMTIQGAHAGERNKRGETPNQANIGISLLGNFDTQTVTAAQERALRQLIAHLESTYGIPNREVYTHNEIRQKYGVGSTGCPGKNLAALVADIQRRGPLPRGSEGPPSRVSP